MGIATSSHWCHFLLPLTQAESANSVICASVLLYFAGYTSRSSHTPSSMLHVAPLVHPDKSGLSIQHHVEVEFSCRETHTLPVLHYLAGLDMWLYFKSVFIIATIRSMVTYMWKIIFVERPTVRGQGGFIGSLMKLLRNARLTEFFKHMSERYGVVSMQRSRNGSIRIFCVFALLRVHRDPSLTT